MFRFILPVFLAFSTAVLADPAVVETRPIPGDPFGDYRISDCSGTRGFGLMTYDADGKVFRLSDLCVLEDSGGLHAVESLRGLQLTKKSRNGRAFEDLASGKSEYQRNAVIFLPNENAPGCSPEPVESIHVNLPNRSVIQAVNDASFAMLQGYTIPATSSNLGDAERQILFGIRSVTQGEMQPKSIQSPNINAFGDMYGTAVFNGSTGTLQVESGGGYRYGAAEGSLIFEVTEDGEFTASGSFSAKSNRIAGHEPYDMVSITGELKYMRGHVLGSDASQMLGYGLVIGTYRDANGQQHRFRASAYLISCAKG